MLDFRMGDCAATIKFILLQSSPHTFLIAERFKESVFEQSDGCKSFFLRKVETHFECLNGG